MNTNAILTALANGTAKNRAKAFGLLDLNNHPVLIDVDGNIIAMCKTIKGQIKPLCIIDDL